MYSLEDDKGVPIGGQSGDFFTDLDRIPPQRSQSMHGGARPEFIDDEFQLTDIQRRRSGSVTSDGAMFDRQRDRMSFGQDMSKPAPTREFVNGVPLLLDLNEILNMDVHSMAMKEKQEQKRTKKQRKIMPEGENEQLDPNMYVEETITMLQQEGQQSETSGEAE